MSEPVSNELIYEVLKPMRADMADMKADIAEPKVRATATDEHIGGLFIATSGNNARLGRVVDRLERIERRLDLTDAC